MAYRWLFLSRRSERPYSWWAVLALALTGVPFWWVSVPYFKQPLIELLLAGGWMFAIGFATLIGYLHANRLPPAGEGLKA